MARRKKSEVEKILETIPTFHEVVPEGNEFEILKKEGFMPFEANKLLEGWKVGLDDKTMVLARQSRIKWWADMLRKGWSKRQIHKAIRQYYDTNAKRTPFDFIKEVYKVQKPKHTATEVGQIMRRRIDAATIARRKAYNITKPLYRLTKTKPRTPVTVTLKGESIRF